MNGRSFFRSDETEGSPRRSWYWRAVKYMESCRLEDGGYFFARIPPSSALDTYFAVKSLRILKMGPGRPQAVVNWILRRIKDSSLSGLDSVFLAAEILSELGYPVDVLRGYVPRVMALQNKAGGFGTVKHLYVEVTSELEATYQALRALQILKVDFDKQGVVRFALRSLNPDGGFGGQGHSNLATTFYATEILRLLGFDMESLAMTKEYLRERENGWQLNFIEDVFWVVEALANFGEKSNIAGRVTQFVRACQRDNGGFARATAIGIPTLEYTFYGVSILKEIGVL